MFAYRELSEGEFQQWQSMYAAATSAYGDDENDNHARKIEQAAEMVEADLELLGSTAVEDSLQSDVPKTLESLRRAGLRFWMLTGRSVG